MFNDKTVKTNSSYHFITKKKKKKISEFDSLFNTQRNYLRRLRKNVFVYNIYSRCYNMNKKIYLTCITYKKTFETVLKTRELQIPYLSVKCRKKTDILYLK